MIRFQNLIAGATVFAAATVAFASHADTVRVDCSYGDLTIARLADGDCLSRIATPTPRPVTVDRLAAPTPVDRSAWTYVTVEAADGQTRSVRVVGPAVPLSDQKRIDFVAHAHENSAFADVAISSVLGYFGIGAQTERVASDQMAGLSETEVSEPAIR